MSIEAPTLSLDYCFPQKSWDCSDSRRWRCCCRCRCYGEGSRWNCQRIVLAIPVGFVTFPCRLKRGDWLAAIACSQALPVPWPIVLATHWLAFGAGKLRLHTHTLGPLFLHQPHRPCCSQHLLSETLEVPEKINHRKLSIK